MLTASVRKEAWFHRAAPNATIFASSASIMAIELLAGRIISRYAGQSLYTWTSIIGIALAGIALGNYLGGRLADRRCDRRVLGALFLLAACTSLSILGLNAFAGNLAALQSFPWPLRIALHVVMVFLAPFTCLGMLSPVISKRALACESTTGRTIGNLFAWSIGGSIAGTFATGFFLLGWIGNTAVLLAVGALLAAIGLVYVGAGTGVTATKVSMRRRPAPMDTEGSRKWPWASLLTVFFAGTCVMTVELAASRMIARNYGQSLYTWTTLIGVILAGLSSGGYFGGRCVERFDARRLLAAVCSGGGAACLAAPLANSILVFRPVLLGLSWPVQILLHTLLVFFLPAFLLGMAPPAAASMALRGHRDEGRIVGLVYAANALGSIAGTFAAGFFLIAAIGAVPSVVLAAAVATLIGLAHAPTRWWNMGWSCVAAFLVCCTFVPSSFTRPLAVALALREQPGAGTIYTDESQYSYIAICAGDIERPNLRTFQLDKLVHSKIDISNPEDLKYEYEWVYSAVLNRFRPGNAAVDALILGGGGYVFPHYLELTRPGAYIETVEIDPAVTEAAHAAFGFPRDTTTHVFHMDARNRVADLIRRKNAGETVPVFSCIFGDSLSDFSVPYHLTTVEYTRMLDSLLTSDGVYMLNLIDRLDCGRFVGAMLNTCGEVFPHVAAFSTSDQPSERATFVIVASKQPLNLDGTAEEITDAYGGRCMRLSDDRMGELRQRVNGLVLTDDYAPVEHLLADVVRKSHDTIVVRRVLRADEYLVTGRLEDAIREAEAAIALDAHRVEAYIVLARALAGRGRTEDAIRTLQKASDLEPRNAAPQEALGAILLRAGRAEDAIAAWKRAVRMNAGDVQTRISLGGALVRAGRAQEAVPHLREAVGRAPQSVTAWTNLSTALYAMRDYDGAFGALEKATALTPEASSLFQQLAVVQLARKNYDAAWAAVKRCEELGGQADAAFLEALRGASARSE